MGIRLIIVAIVFFLIGFGVAWFILGRGEPVAGPDAMVNDEQGEAVSSPTILVGDNGIAAFDQAPGDTVRLAFVALGKDGWAVIHEDRDGKPGNILGAQRFPAGEYPEGGTVELLRGTEEGGTYYAMLHYDDDDKEFDLTKDLPATDKEGNVILMKFIATSNPVEE